MDPFTEKLLEKTRQRREQLQERLKSTPSSATRKRKPLQIDTSENSTVNSSTLNGSEKVEEKRRKSLKSSNSSLNRKNSETYRGSENQEAPASGNIPAGGPAPRIGRHISVGAHTSSLDLPSPTPATRKGRLQKLAAQINNWEDDLSHPLPSKTESQHSVVPPTSDSADGEPKKSTTGAKPPKPPRAFQVEEKVEERQTNRYSPRLAKQSSEKSVNDAFAFGSAPPKATPSRQAKPRAPVPAFTSSNKPTPSASNSSDEEPTKKAVADRFSMWEKKTGDVLTPLRQANPLHGARSTPQRAAKTTSAGAPGSVTRAASHTPSQQTQTTQFKPQQQQNETRLGRPAETRPGQSRRRSRSAAAATPEREHTGASAPWNKPGAALGSAAPPSAAKPAAPSGTGQQATPKQRQASSTDDEWSKAPMSARKFAWEAKIAEQQNVANEHNRVMYRTRSATRLEGTPCQKQHAEDKLRQGQEKVYDPAERAKREREAELRNLQNRFNNKGMLRDGASIPQTSESSKHLGAESKGKATSMESLEDQEYFTASDSEHIIPTSSNNATAGSSAEEIKPAAVPANRRQVSFKSPTRAAASVGRRKSESPAESEQELERKVRRRSSCKLPTLGYDSSSSEDEVTPNTRVMPMSPRERGGERASPNKIPRLGDESSADSFDDMRQVSGSSIGSSVSSYSYHFVAGAGEGGASGNNARDVVDFLDEAMSDDEPEPSPVRLRRSPRVHSSSSASPAGLFSVDQYRQTTKSAAKLPSSMTAMRSSSVYDTDNSSLTDDTCSSQQSVSDLDRRNRIKELQAMVQREQNVIVQASNALNQCCKTGSSFAGSTEQVECNRLLLIACQRRQAYLAEIEMIKANPRHYEKRNGKGSLTISDIQLPLKREFVKKIGTPEDDTVHYFLLMVRAGAQVVVTQMVSTHDALMRGTLHFPNLIKLNDIMNDFKYELEIYGMQVSRESSLKQSGKKDKKKGASLSRGRENPLSSSTVRATNFTHITSLILTMSSIRSSSFKLSRVPYLSPLHGTINLHLRCTMQANIVFKGFINMFEDVGGFGAWHRRWCVLNNHKITYWKYPDDEMNKEAIGELRLKECVTEEVGLVSREKCARPNTIELVLVRPATRADNATGRNREIRDRMLYEQHWLGMDTKVDRLEWCAKLNEALANVRQWFSDAPRPVPSNRMEI